MELFKKEKKVVINAETGEVKDFNPKDYNKEKYEIIDLDKHIKYRKDYKIMYSPSEKTWDTLGMSSKSQVVNEISKDYIPKGRLPKYNIINDEILEVDNTFTFWFFLMFGILAIWLLGILIYGCIIYYDETPVILMVIMSLLVIPCVLIGLYWGIRGGVYPPIRKLRFNRINGTIEMAKPWFKGWSGKNTITIPFRDLNVGLVGTMVRSLSIIYPNSWFFRPPLGLDNNAELSLVVWFMDRNRPLPPGEIFDPYRMKDYERRKAEGFPEPLFVALFKMPNLKRAPDLSKLKLIKKVGGNDGIIEVPVEL